MGAYTGRSQLVVLEQGLGLETHAPRGSGANLPRLPQIGQGARAPDWAGSAWLWTMKTWFRLPSPIPSLGGEGGGVQNAGGGLEAVEVVQHGMVVQRIISHRYTPRCSFRRVNTERG